MEKKPNIRICYRSTFDLFCFLCIYIFTIQFIYLIVSNSVFLFLTIFHSICQSGHGRWLHMNSSLKEVRESSIKLFPPFSVYRPVNPPWPYPSPLFCRVPEHLSRLKPRSRKGWNAKGRWAYVCKSTYSLSFKYYCKANIASWREELSKGHK